MCEAFKFSLPSSGRIKNGNEKESSIEKGWPCILLGFMFSLRFVGCPLFFIIF